MKKQELIEWDKTLKGYALPDYMEITDSTLRKVMVDGKWMYPSNAWGLFPVGEKWRYVETEVERRYITYSREFESEEEACAWIKDYFEISMYPSDEHEYYKEVAKRVLTNEIGYERVEAETIINKFDKKRKLQRDLCECLMLGWDLDPRRASRVEISGYSAERLVREYKMGELEAFEFLLKLSENRKAALHELEKRNK